jgi:hypothetical protein
VRLGSVPEPPFYVLEPSHFSPWQAQARAAQAQDHGWLPVGYSSCKIEESTALPCQQLHDSCMD